MVVFESCHKQFLTKHKIQKPQAAVREKVAKLPGNENEHFSENSHDAFSLGFLPRKYGSN